MDPRRIESHPQAPEVTCGDVWDEPACWDPAGCQTATVLPARKALAKSAAAAAAGSSAERSGEGLRIEAKTQRRPLLAGELEVQEIGGKVMRLDPEVAVPERVARHIHYRPREARKSSRGEGKEWGLTSKMSIRWILATGVGVATVVVTAMLLLPLIPQSNAARSADSIQLLLADEPPPIDGIELMQELYQRRDEACRIYGTVAAAATVEEILPWLSNPAAVEPILRKHHRAPALPADWFPDDHSTSWSILDNDGCPFGLLAGTLPDASRFNAYWVLHDQRLRLDWKATTGYGTATFEELARQQGNADEIRGTIIPAGFFTATFPEAEFQSYQLFSPDGTTAIWCYAPRGLELDQALEQICRGADPLNPVPQLTKVTIRLGHGPAEALPNQWLILAVLHKEWLNLSPSGT